MKVKYARHYLVSNVLCTSIGNEIRRKCIYIYLYSNSSLISLATISKILFFFFFSRRERNMLASPHRWEANRSSCPRAPLCMQIVCIFILLHSVYDNSFFCISLSPSLPPCLRFFSSSLSRVFSTKARRKMKRNKNSILLFIISFSRIVNIWSKWFQ